MSVARLQKRDVVPILNSMEEFHGKSKHETQTGRKAGCLWSLCSGKDHELSSSQDEDVNLVNLREVHIKFGSQAMDSASDTEEGGQSCELSNNVAETALSVAYITMGLVATAGVFTVDAVSCRDLSNQSSGPNFCTYLVAGSLPLVAAGLALSAIGVKNLVQAYKERNNT